MYLNSYRVGRTLGSWIIKNAYPWETPFNLSYQNTLASSSRWLYTSASLKKARPVDSPDHPDEDYFKKNERLKRPMAPHLTIYKLEITSVLSVTHRGTGGYLAFLTSGFAIWSLFAPHNFPYYVDAIQSAGIPSIIFLLAKASITSPFVFHFLNGIRHLAWDMGWGFSLKQVSATGLTVVGLSIVLGLALAAL